MHTVKIIPDIELNPIMDTDSYKFSHWPQYPQGANYMESWFCSRGGEFDTCTLMGLQPELHKFLTKKITKAHVDQAQAFADKHGVPFNYKGWMKVVTQYNGHFPVKIMAIPEGTVVPTGNILLKIRSVKDPDVFWVANWLETRLVRLWYPSTIATNSRECKKGLIEYLKQTSVGDPMALVLFMLHDFGGRGVACYEQAQIGGCSHLASFMGSDTVVGVDYANHYYGIDMSGFSIAATEHSTITSWGRDNERDAYSNVVRIYLEERNAPEGMLNMVACVSDSYDIYQAVEMWTTGDLKERIKKSGGRLIIRPDSGTPVVVLKKIFDILLKNLGDEIETNSKGFKVLPMWIRVIQGDGITRTSMFEICDMLMDRKWSIENIAFGSGGGLLQMFNRDTQKFAFKCCYMEVNGVPRDVLKDPITDPGKKSKAGRLDLIKKADGTYETIALPEGMDQHPDSVLVTYYDCGEPLYHQTFDEVRKRMAL